MEKVDLYIDEILLVDDEEQVLTILKTFVNTCFNNIKIHTAKNGLEALKILNSNSQLKVIVTDLKMPELDGISFLERVKKIDEKIEVIILTGIYDETSILKALKLGATDFLIKPIDLLLAKEAVVKACDKIKMRDVLNSSLEQLKDQKEKLSIANKTISDMNIDLKNTVDEQVKRIMDNEIAVGYGELIQGIIHNINTPLSTINGGIDILKMAMIKDMKNDKNNYDYYLDRIDKIKGAVKNVISIIKGTMQRSRDENSVEKMNLDVNKLIEQELDFFEANMFFKHQITKEFSFANDLPNINIIYSDFSQIIINLIQNSLDAMWNSETKILTVKTKLERDSIALYISDSGCGIDAKDLEKIFEIFYTTKARENDSKKTKEPVGNGLGMHTVNVIAKKYGIKIDVTSDIGRGTIFKLSIPIKENN